ncbi:O-antigen polymerase [Alkalibaculum bacchi]|uniref:O-antigen polymerase n=1 Tax=Alkalibaculum bacchi TaxID=645887 RepID=UPI0026EA571C|nr:O-antigen polymerase [Alkalibaculum bacchi]
MIIIKLIFEDFKLYKTIFTPFSIISITYLSLILLNNYVAVHLGFFKVEVKSIAYILYFLVLIYLISRGFYYWFKDKNYIFETNNNNYEQNVVIRHQKLIVSIFIVGLVAKYVSLVQVLSIYGLGNIKGKAFGLFAHLGDLGLILTPYLMILYLHYKKPRYLILILLMYVNLFVFGGKYGIIIAILHLIILYAMITDFEIKRTLKIGLFLMLFGIITFVIIYAILPSIINNKFNILYLINRFMLSIKHFFYYLISPVIATNYYFENVGLGSIEVLFTVPINIVKAIFQTGNYINPVNSFFIPIHTSYRTNVGGLFAETVYNSNFLIASIYVAIFFICVYYIFNISRYKGKMISLSAMLLAIIAMMFFCNFITVSGIIIPLIFLFIIEFIMMKE